MPLDIPNHLSRCTVFKGGEHSNGHYIVPENNQQYLSEKALVDYYEYRKSFLTWLLKFGKDPTTANGYSPYTVYNTGYRTAAFDLWSWERNGQYAIPPTQEDATAYMEEAAFSDVADSTKGKKLEALRRYSKWLQDYYGKAEWEFRWEFKSGGGNSGPRDFLSIKERRAIRQAALDVDGNPAYGVGDMDALDVAHGSW